MVYFDDKSMYHKNERKYFDYLQQTFLIPKEQPVYISFENSYETMKFMRSQVQHKLLDIVRQRLSILNVHNYEECKSRDRRGIDMKERKIVWVPINRFARGRHVRFKIEGQWSILRVQDISTLNL